MEYVLDRKGVPIKEGCLVKREFVVDVPTNPGRIKEFSEPHIGVLPDEGPYISKKIKILYKVRWDVCCLVLDRISVDQVSLRYSATIRVDRTFRPEEFSVIG